jgi:hypothetical protein
VIGGTKAFQSLLARDFDVPSSCFEVEISTGKIAQRADLLTGRYYFGVCSVGGFIYTFGGRDSKHKIL